MALSDLLTQKAVVLNLHARCKREALAMLADRAAGVTGADATAIREALIEREKLGSTGVGRGVAIPHGKIEGLGAITGLLAKLDAPIDFEAVDEQPVDLIFVLLAPADASAAHLKALARVSRLLRDERVREALRGAETPEALFTIAVDSERPHAA
ncbi:MAG TPA: transcriptional regulator [Parvularcula sp.]|nr:transcriptional regulator [Parvularcula sp.]HBS30586.1 transcriptional regulator [Parvularcula sp.]HBS36744.1 transcriptional regulator [Parvularcula sp.]